MGRTEISRIKDKLKRGTLSVFDIPEEFQNAAQIITLERKLSLREITRCGYDVISNLFFVEENLHDADEKGRILCSWFEKFAAYYDFLEGQIYHNACYAFFDFSEKLIKAYGLNLSELNRSALIEKTIDDYPLIPPMERETFLQGGNLLDLYKYWEERFNSCVTFEELLSVEKEFLKSELSNSVDSSFFLTQYVLKNYEREKNLAVCLMLVRKCFICTNKRWNGRLYILNGGTIKGLAQNDVQYYFENMDVMAEAVKSPLNKYSEFQKAIGATVRKIGGWGTIHGCIVDIDGYNHLYVNPFDGTVTPYYAVDMIQKVAYPSIQNLLEKNCPKLFANYSLLFEKGTEEITALTKYPRKPIVYLGTEMYRASREIKKMQKLYTNILSFWDDTVLHEKRIEEIDVKTGE